MTARRVLVVDDSEVIREAARRGLESAGWEVEIADGGIPGLEAAIERPPDVILLDLVMPDLNGAEVLRQLREHPSHAETPILLLTSSADAELYADEVAGIIPKPFSPAALDGRIRTTLGWPAEG